VKYKLIGKNNLLEPMGTVLRNRGIEDIQSFLHVSEKDIVHWSKLKNIVKAADCLLEHIEKGSKIYIQVDADPDGYTASATLINYLTKIFPDINIYWRLHEGKEHGVIVSEVPNDVNLVIIPDAGSNQFEEHKQLKERNIDVIVLDHHECSEESEDAIVVNSQLSPDYPNKQFSGVGITYKFCKALDDKLGVKQADEYLDLVAIGNVADSQDMRSLETRYFVLKGLKNLKNKFIKALFDKQSYSTKDIVNITTTGFYINPLINACIRVGNMEEKKQMFRAFLGSNEKIHYKKKSVEESIEVNTARVLGNLKAKQDRIRNKAIEEIDLKIESKNLLNNKLLIVDITDILHKNLTGVVANKCAEKYKRPAMLLRFSEDEEFLTGSIRGYEKGYFNVRGAKGEYIQLHKNMINGTGAQPIYYYLSYTNAIRSGSGSGNLDSSFNGNRPFTLNDPNLVGYNPGTSDIKAFLEATFYPSQSPTAALTISYSSTTSSSIDLEEMASGSALAITLNWTGGRQASTATLSTINVESVNQTFSQPSAPGSVSGTKSSTAARNTTSTYTNTVTTSDGKAASATASIHFYYKRYYGFVSSNSPSDGTIQALTNEFITARIRSTTSPLTPSGSQFFCIAFPESFDVSNVSQIWVGGLDQTASFNRTTQSFTNASGATTSYIVYTTKLPTSGDVSFEIK
jgi:single-stranded-DNA-specific exonuclease RecJ